MQDIPRSTPPAGSPNLTLIEQLTIPGTFSRVSSPIRVVDLPEGLEDHGDRSTRRTFAYDPDHQIIYLAPNNAYHNAMYE